MSRGRKWLRRFAWLAATAVAVVLVLWFALHLLMRQWVAQPPAGVAEGEITRLRPEVRGERVWLGSNWIGRREGLAVLYVTGTPFEMGYANGVLTKDLLHRQEDSLLRLMRRAAPFQWTRFLLKFLVVYKNRHLAAHVVPEHQQEMLGLVRGCPDAHPEIGPLYHRILNYHAAQDISYMFMNSPLIRKGCTSFGAWGTKTQGGHLLCGRNFDWEADPVFEQDRLVVLCQPAQGIPFVSLAWAGMVGCVSGLNREGLSVTVNGAPSDLPGAAATPTCLVAREVLQCARTIEEAIAIIRQRRVFVSALFLVGSRRDGRFVVVEKTPQRMAVRETGPANYIVCANHYQTPELETEPINQEFKRVDTSVPRHDRAKELLDRWPGQMDERLCAALLRDRQLPGNQSAGNGHRSALNPLIATHAVVMDLTAGTFWAGTTPHQLGRFVAFDMSDWEKHAPEKTIPEDNLLASGEYARFLAARALLGKGRAALKRHRYEEALQCARAAETNNPGFYQNAWLEAESLRRLGRREEAARACQTALQGKPALAGERKKIEELARAVANRGARPNPSER